MNRGRDELRVWGSDVDEGTRAQARRAIRLPSVPGHVAPMPDAHMKWGIVDFSWPDPESRRRTLH